MATSKEEADALVVLFGIKDPEVKTALTGLVTEWNDMHAAAAAAEAEFDKKWKKN